MKEECCKNNKEECSIGVCSIDEIKDNYDYIIIGWGAAAFAGAIKAQELGVKNILMVGFGLIGGTCVNVGCVPSKFMLNAGELYNYSANNKYFQGVSLKKNKLDYTKLVKQKNKLVLGQRQEKYQKVVDALKNVDVVDGKATFVSKDTITVNGKKIKADKFLIANGSRTFIPPIEGIEKVNYLTNVEALELNKLPKSMIILGASTLGLEFAQMFNNFGTKVTVIQRSNTILTRLEPEISTLMHETLLKDGIDVLTAINSKKVSEKNNEIFLEVEMDSKNKIIRAEKLLIATGRIPNSDLLGIENTTVEINKKAVKVNKYLQTSQENIYATGDIIGEPMLETVAGYEGSLATSNIFGKKEREMDFNNVPYGIFTNPQIAGVGLSEKELKEKGIEYDVRTLSLDMVPKNAIVGETNGLIKMMIEPKTTKILGCHMIGSHAADIIQEVVLAKKYGICANEIIDSLHIFPTITEAIKLICVSFQKDLKKLSCCV